MKTTKLKADALCAVILLLPDVFVSLFFGSYIFDVIFATLLLFVTNSHYRFLLFCIFSRTRQVAFGIHICLSVVVLMLFCVLKVSLYD